MCCGVWNPRRLHRLVIAGLGFGAGRMVECLREGGELILPEEICDDNAEEGALRVRAVFMDYKKVDGKLVAMPGRAFEMPGDEDEPVNLNFVKAKHMGEEESQCPY